MPCTNGDEPRFGGYAPNPEDAQQRRLIKELAEKVDELTAMLCSTLSQTRDDINDEADFKDFCDDVSKAGGTSESVYAWYENHRKDDKRRIIKQLRDTFSLEEIKQIKNLFKNDDL